MNKERLESYLFARNMLELRIQACKNQYCMSCAEKAKSEGVKCVKCQQLIFI